MITFKTKDFDYVGTADRVAGECLSTDTKPTTGVANGSTLLEMDTATLYIFSQAGLEWIPITAGGGGGGSSDFSTATVTVVNTGTPGDVLGSMPICREVGELAPEAPALIETTFDVEAETTGVFLVPIYKNGMANAIFDDAVTIASVTGNAMWDGEEHDVFISGDCTITAQRPL